MNEVSCLETPKAVHTTAPRRISVQCSSRTKKALSRSPLALRTVLSLVIDPEVRLYDDAISTILDKLVVVDSRYSSRVSSSARVVRAKKLKSPPRRVLCEEQSASLVNINNPPRFDTECPTNMHR